MLRLLGLKKMHILMLRAFTGPLLAGYGVSLFVLVLQFLAQQRNKLFGKGLPVEIILEVMGYAAIALSVVALILGVLLASLMTLGRLGENYELTALKSSGISLWRILYPLIVFVGLLAAVSVVMTSFVEPWAKLKMYTRLYDADRTRPQFALRPGVFNDLIPGYVLRITGRKEDGSMLYGMRIYDHTTDQKLGNVVITADSARMQNNDSLLYLNLELYHGVRYQDELKQRAGSVQWNPERPFTLIAFDTLLYNIDMSAFLPSSTDEEGFLSHPYMLSLPRLIDTVRVLQQEPIQALNSFEKGLEGQLFVHQRLDSVAQKPGAPPIALPKLDTLPKPERDQVLRIALRSAQVLLATSTSAEATAAVSAENLRRYAIELNLKFTLPFSILLFVFVGGPLGAIIRKGGFGAPIVVAIVFFVVYYVLMSYGKKTAREGALPVIWGVWLPVLVMLPTAVYLSFQSATDSRLLDLSAWRQVILRLVGRGKPRIQA